MRKVSCYFETKAVVLKVQCTMDHEGKISQNNIRVLFDFFTMLTFSFCKVHCRSMVSKTLGTLAQTKVVALTCTDSDCIFHLHSQKKQNKTTKSQFSSRMPLMKQYKFLILLNLNTSVCLLNIMCDVMDSILKALLLLSKVVSRKST